LGILAIAAIAFVVWANGAPPPTAAAVAALQSDAAVTVTDVDGVLRFEPNNQDVQAGLIFYPGGRVDYHSYAAPLRLIAEQGYLVLVPDMPLNLAFFNADAAEDLIAANPEIDTWVLGGHSLGGAMAAEFASNSADLIDGIVFWAAYPAGNNDLSGSTLQFTSIYGSADGVATLEDIDASRALLPQDTTWTEIDGGNHAQFGSYGPQSGDGVALISEAEQHAAVAAATVNLLEQVAE
jgi:predicted esterase